MVGQITFGFYKGNDRFLLSSEGGIYLPHYSEGLWNDLKRTSIDLWKIDEGDIRERKAFLLPEEFIMT